MSKKSRPNSSCAQDAVGIAVADQGWHLLLLCHVPSMGSCSQFCLIMHPHRAAVPFPPTFALPWRNNFVQIHGETTLLLAKFGITPQKRPKNDQIRGWGHLGRAVTEHFSAQLPRAHCIRPES